MAEQPDGKVGGFNLTLREVKETDAGDFMLWAADEEVKQFCGRHVNPWRKPGHTSPHSPFHIYGSESSVWTECQSAPSPSSKAAVSPNIEPNLATSLPEVERIEAVVAKENVASQRVREKSGFVKEGLLCKYLSGKGRTIDCFMYRLLSSDNMPL
eukprot:Gb_01747 [translate_table: standard]